jgi:hypothetical protein
LFVYVIIFLNIIINFAAFLFISIKSAPGAAAYMSYDAAPLSLSSMSRSRMSYGAAAPMVPGAAAAASAEAPASDSYNVAQAEINMNQAERLVQKVLNRKK